MTDRMMKLLLLASTMSLAHGTAATAGTLVPRGVRVWNVARDGGIVSPEAGVLADSVLSDPQRVPVQAPHDYGKKFVRMMDGVPPAKRSYVVPGLKPFRFRYFTNEFSYGGWHNWNMSDYAASHGFKYIWNYGGRPPVNELPHLPEGTEYLTWGGFNWGKWMQKEGIGEKRFDQLMGVHPSVAGLGKGAVFTQPAGANRLLMIDIEHSPLMPEALREQPWYPKGSLRAKASFERKYYAGFARTYTLPIKLARRAGWRQIGIYGWDPGGRQVFGWKTPEKLRAANEQRWQLYGRLICAKVDVIYNSVYCFYWTPDNPAYVLANLDENRRMIERGRPAKPMRPYYRWLLHHGGPGWRWWRFQPLPDPQVESITVLGFFTGQKGMVLWSWSGTGSDQVPPRIDLKPSEDDPETQVDVQIGTAFTAPGTMPGGAATSRRFERYEHVHVLRVTDGRATFQLLGSGLGEKHGVNDKQPVYTMQAEELRQHLRPPAEPVGAMFKGLALVHRFEEFLANGDVKVDVPAASQLTERLPIVRRVQRGNLHLVATCDPHVPAGMPGRPVVLKNFNGKPGQTVTLPTQQRVQLFVLRTGR